MKKEGYIGIFLFALILSISSMFILFLLESSFILLQSRDSFIAPLQVFELLLNLLSLFLFWAGLLGILSGGILLLILTLSQRWKLLYETLFPIHERTRNWGILLMLLGIPYIVYFSIEIFSGAGVSRSGLRPYLTTSFIIIASILAYLVSKILIGSLIASPNRHPVPASIHGRSRSPLRFWMKSHILQIFLFIAGTSFFIMNALVLPLYYPIFHITLSLLSALSFGLCIIPSYMARFDSMLHEPRFLPSLLSSAIIVIITLSSPILNHTFLKKSNLYYLINQNGVSSSYMMKGVNLIFFRPKDDSIYDYSNEAEIGKNDTGSLQDNVTRYDDRADISSPGASMDDERKNILLITIDALRSKSMSLYGYERKTTPQIDKFSRMAKVFDRFYTTSPHTSYSISSLFTSRYFLSFRRINDSDRGLVTIPEVLDDYGYHNEAIFTSSIFFTKGEDFSLFKMNSFGFSSVTSDNLCYEARYQTPRVIDKIKNLWGKRFFLWVHYFDPHEPYKVVPDFYFGDSPLDKYESEIGYVDNEIGKIIRFLEENNLLDDIYIIITADHGEAFGEHRSYHHGFNLYEEEINIPLIIGGKGIEGEHLHHITGMIDIAPTILGLLGIPPVKEFDGKDLSPLIQGEEMVSKDFFAFSENLNNKMAYIKGDEKVIFSANDRLWEYYDLRKDPGEKRNITLSKAEKFSSMKKDMANFLKRTIEFYKNIDSSPQDEFEMNLHFALLGEQEGKIKFLRSLEHLDKERRETIAPKLVKVPGIQTEEAVKFLLPLVEKGGNFAFYSAIVLAKCGIMDEKVRETLYKALTEENEEIRYLSAVQLGKVGDLTALPILLEGIKKRNGDLRREMVQSLCYIDSDEAIYRLTKIIKSGEPELRRAAAENLGRNGNRKHLLPLLNALSDTYHLVRLGAVRGLVNIHDRESIEELKRHLNQEDDEEVREAIVDALNKLGEATTLSP